MSDTTLEQSVNIIVQACWFAGISEQQFLAMPPPALAALAADHDVSIDRMIEVMREIGRRHDRQARVLRDYAASHGHA